MTTHYQTLPGRTLCNDQSRKFKKLTTMAGEVTCPNCKKIQADSKIILMNKFIDMGAIK